LKKWGIYEQGAGSLFLAEAGAAENPSLKNRSTPSRLTNATFRQHPSHLLEDQVNLIMKLQLLLSLLGLLAITASGLATQKAVIVSYPNETPDSVISRAMDAVREAVGQKCSHISRVY
jgi:hypothetical protein